MRRYCAWDIETAPTAEALAEPYPEDKRLPPSNYSKPETISEWRRKDRESWETDRIKEFSFSPRTGRIVALSLNFKGEEYLDLSALDAKDEKQLIIDALTIMSDTGRPGARNDLLVGFNSRSFDWPFLMLRMCYHRIDHLAVCPDRQWWQAGHNRYSLINVDVRDIVTFNQPGQKGTLSDWAAWAGQAVKDTAGSQIYQWVQEGNVDAITTHCRGDAQRTGALFERVYPLYAGA